jgi:hypothetical protein
MPTGLERSAILPPAPQVHEHLVLPLPEFAADYAAQVQLGRYRLRHAKVCFVGLARDCASALAGNLSRVLRIAGECESWRLHIEENDSADDTVQVLADFASEYRQATFASQRLGRESYSGEFGGRRTVQLAEYRTACQRWVRENAADCDYVMAVDFDAWGGWWHDGVLNGIGWMVDLQGAFGMASVSLLEHPSLKQDDRGHPVVSRSWLHYDCWAARGIGQPDVYFDDYTRGEGGWKHNWLPPVGSSPVVVASAFGGLCIYRTEDYLHAEYDGSSDCEHTSAHRAIAKKTGKRMFVNPSQRTFMRWMHSCDPPSEGV